MRLRAFAMALALLAGTYARACDVGLVLAGGGARGGAHIGVLRALEAAHVPVGCIAGTSIGAIIAALYATGASPDEIEAFAASVDWDRVFSDRVARPARAFRRKHDDELALLHPGIGYSDGRFKLRGGLVTGNNIGLVLARIAARAPGERNFDRLRIPLRVVATDIATGGAVVFDHGDLAETLRASMAVPGVFAPVAIDGRLLVDGGVADNLPIDVVRAMGARVVIAVDVSEPLLPQSAIRSAVDVTEQLTNILTRRNTDAQRASIGARDVLLTPDLADFGNTDFDRMPEMAPRGVAAVQQSLPRLAALALPGDAYATRMAALRDGAPPPPVLAFYTLHNDSRLTNGVLRRMMRLEELVGQSYSPALLQDHLAPAYGTELFEHLHYAVVRRDAVGGGAPSYGVDLAVQEKAWGPDFLNLHLLAESDFAGAAAVSLGLDYQRTNFSRGGGEWRSYLQLGEERLIFTELYQPIGRRDGWFVQPRLLYANRALGLFGKSGDREAEVDLAEMHAEIRLGYEFDTVARVEVGARAGQFEAHARVGTGLPRADDRNIGEWFAAATYDSLDDRFFPARGARVALEGLSGRGLFGADDHFDHAELDATAVTTLGQVRVLGRAAYARTLRGVAPLHRRPRIGGLLRPAGVAANELTGQQAMLLGVSVYRPLRTPWFASYAGIALGYGDVREDEHFAWHDLQASGSVWAGADLPIGPLYFGYGWIEGTGDTFFVSLGRLP